MEQSIQQTPCAKCGNMGYTDERKYCSKLKGYICIRCERPDIDWPLKGTW